MQEIWKFYKIVKRTTRHYKKGSKLYVSNLGRCRVDNEIIEPCKYGDGYRMFCNIPMHRLVYELFVGEIPKGYEIDHINTIRDDNKLENLRCVTRKENINNPISKEHCKNRIVSEETRKKMSITRKGKTGLKHNRSKPVNQIDMNTHQVIKTWPCTYEVERELGINHSCISLCCSGHRKTAGGYVWRYKD